MTDQLDMARLGEHVVNILAASRSMGHVSPLGALEYAEAGSAEGQLLLDVLRECRYGGDEGATARLDKFVDDHQLLDRIAEAVAR